MKKENRKRIENYPLHDSMRGHFGFELYKLMAKNPDIIIITADLGYGLFDPHRDDYPEQFINVGAAEQAMIGAGIGLALEGKIPICYSITPFLLYRPFEFIRYINEEQIPVILIGGGRNDDYKHDGASHWAFEDGGIMMMLPNIDCYWPDSKEAVPELLEQIISNKRPAYLNLHR